MSDRSCKHCTKALAPRPDEQAGNFARREFCGGSCRSLWLVAHRTRHPGLHPRYERIREVLAKEPELEGWQIAERFGLDRAEARELRRRLLQQMAIKRAC